MKISNLEEWEDIRKNSGIKLLADESCVNEEDFYKLSKVAHGVNIKNEKTGGLFNSLKAILKAGEFGLEIILGTMVCTNLGCTQTFQMHPLVEYFDIDGFLLVRDPKPKSGFTWEKGGKVLPE